MFLDKLLKVEYCTFQTHQIGKKKSSYRLSSNNNVMAPLHFSWPPEAALRTVLIVIFTFGWFYFFFCFASSYCSHAFSHIKLYPWCHVWMWASYPEIVYSVEACRLINSVCVPCNKLSGNHWIHRPVVCLRCIHNKYGAVCEAELS